MQINPESPNIESEIAELEQKLAEKRAALQGVGASEKEKEALHESVAEKIAEHAPEHEPKPFKGSSSSDDDDDEDDTKATKEKSEAGLPSYEDPEIKEDVKNLVSYAFAESIDKATKKAVSTKSPAIIDAFHDVLVDELYDYMIQKGTIEKPQ